MKRKPLRQIYEESDYDFPSASQLFRNPLQLYNIKSRTLSSKDDLSFKIVAHGSVVID